MRAIKCWIVRLLWYNYKNDRCRFCGRENPCAGTIEKCDHNSDCFALRNSGKQRSV